MENLDHYLIGRLADIHNYTHLNCPDGVDKLIHQVISNTLNTIITSTGLDVLSCLPKDKIFLANHEKRVFSQFGEDGILEKIFELIGTTNKFYLDFGGTEHCGNTKFIHLEKGFNGVMWNGQAGECTYNTIHEEFVTRENVVDLCKKYNIPVDLDFLSIDIDGNDWYIWKQISTHLRPRVVCIEYNGEFSPLDDKVVVYDPTFTWDFSNYFGATCQAMYNLGRTLGYSLVCCNQAGNNAFFIRDDCVPDCIHGINDVSLLYRSLKSTTDVTGYNPEPKTPKVWLKSSDLLKI